MTALTPLPFAGTDEELEKYLLEFARLTGGWAGLDRRSGGWILLGGSRGSTNPNTIARKLRITRMGGGLSFASEVRALPWTRSKIGRIAEFREGQLADYLTARVRGSGPEKFDTLRLREPFAPFGSGVAGLTASFAWAVATSISVSLLVFLFTVAASMPLMSRSIRDIAAHSEALARAGTVPLPSAAEAASTGVLGPAVVFAVPIAFFSALICSAAFAASDLGFRMARAPQAAYFFLVIMITAAFFPFVPVLALPLALLVPLGAHLGASVVWGRRRERIRDGPRPRPQVVIIGVILAASLAGAAVPRASEWKESTVQIALFRDRFLLDNPLGKAIAAAYYRYTLYTAEPMKELFASDGHRATRLQPIAHSKDPVVASRLRALGFTVASDPALADVTVGAGGVDPGPDEASLRSALDGFGRRTFRGVALRELGSLAWRSIYYLGPPAMLVVSMGAFAPFISLLFRKFSPRQAVFGLSAIAIVTSLGLVLLTGGAEPQYDAATLAEALSSWKPAFRHEAAYRASRLESTSALADPLVQAAADPDLRVRLWACAALGRSGDPRALGVLVNRLEDPELFVRYRAAEGLGFLKDARAEEPLLRMMREKSWYEGLYALEALRAIRPGNF